MTTKTTTSDIDPGDPRETPAYKLSETSVYLGIPASTLRSWIIGRSYPTNEGPREFAPLIDAADDVNSLLSFANLAEAHVLQATRDQRIPIPNVRRAIDYIQDRWPSRHPLITKEFYKFGKQLFIKELDPSIEVNATKAGQIGLKEILEDCLERLGRDDTGYPIRIFPLHTPSTRPGHSSGIWTAGYQGHATLSICSVEPEQGRRHR